jgi:hypothetical protein
VDGRTDVYSLGCVLYECLTGRAPFAGRSAPGTLYAHMHEEPSRPSSLRPDLPSAVDAVVGRALAKEPDARYASCRDLTLDLRAALTGAAALPSGATEPSPQPAPARRRAKPLWIAAAAVVTALVVGLVGFVVIDRGGHRGTSPGPSPSASTPSGVPQLIREGVQVTASHTAPSAKDAAGHLVTYLPSNVIDGDVQTAWRVQGDGRGEILTLIFDGPVDIVRVGLIPGYAKFDPETGANRFEQDRTITVARWLIPGLPPTVQHFQPLPVPQFVRVSATASRITVQIVGTTKPGGLDFTAISEIYVYGYPQ